MGPVDIALFGLGRAGDIHLQNITRHPGLRLKYIVEQDAVEKARGMVQQHGLHTQVVAAADADKVFKDHSVAGVVICTPTFTHEDYVLRALKHEKSVFCEKPIASEIESAWNCYHEAEKVNKPLICSFNRRFDPMFSSARSRAHTGAVGIIHTVHTVARDSPLPTIDYLKISGGIYHDCAVHDIDLVCWVLQEFPCSVSVEATCHDPDIRALDDVDTTSILLRFTSGALATINLSRHATYGYDQRLEIFGSDGMVRCENSPDHPLEVSSKRGVSMGTHMHSFPQRYRQSYINALDHFVNVINGVEDCCISGNDALAVAMIADACEQSYRTDAKVKLNLQHFREAGLVSKSQLSWQGDGKRMKFQ